MKPKKRILLGLAVGVLIPFCTALVLLRPDTFTAVCLLVLTALAFFMAWLILRGHVFAPVNSISSQWPSRSTDPDKMVDRLVSEVEQYIVDVQEGKDRLSDTGIRQNLHRRLSSMVEKATGLQVGSQTLEVTVLLSDLRGFSVITESYSPLEVVDMLNRYLDQMCAIIYRHGGTVDKFMGDSIMALFGAPVRRQDPVMQAIRCAVEMQIAMDSFNKENQGLGLPTLYMGIGINTGEVVAGKIGSDLHSEYTVIGEEVTIASRIEAYTLRGQILISRETYSRVKDHVHVADPINVSVKGRREPMPLYELLEIGDPYNLKVPEREARRSLRVDVNIPFNFQVCEGKVVYPENHEGRILNISTGGMFAATLDEVEPYFNLKFKPAFTALGESSDDIYGKILRVKEEAGLYEMNIEFTAIKPKDVTALKQLVDHVVQGSFGPVT
ncbi:MAG: PilZ domain-containing protein [Deltaproteobacteria bacterium]|nr:PilZ domain-containing protein [Deltaproteobacteria bacterium]MBW2078422.1 PilZ domain-containing protein [Deltaproteobacteria bacterium]